MSAGLESLTGPSNELATSTEPPNEVTFSGPPDLSLPDSFIYPAMAATFTLFLISLLNMAVITYHWKQMWTNLISFIYVILSLSDMLTGLCSLLHTFIFLVVWVLGPDQGDLCPGVFAFVLPAHFITQVAFKLSAFVSMVFAVIRTINIAKPLTSAFNINKQAVVVSILVYGLIWVGVCVTQLSFILTEYLDKLEGVPGALVTRDYVTGLLFQPNSPLLLNFNAAEIKCSVGVTYTLLPLALCAAITFITTVIQVVQLNARSSTEELGAPEPGEDRDRRRGISTTVILICALFVVCAGVVMTVPIDTCVTVRNGHDRARWYFMGFVPYFVNAAFNPVILVVRVKSLREFMFSRVRKGKGRSGKSDKRFLTYRGSASSNV